MNTLRRFVAMIAPAVLLAAGPARASDDQQTLWGAWFNTQKLGGSWVAHTDIQLRSTDGADDLRNTLVRGAVGYQWPNGVVTSLGYAYIDTHSPNQATLTEHRPFLQLIAPQTVAGAAITHRLRLEQRFIERSNQDGLYSDRLRYFVRVVKPLAASADGKFASGPFVALQEEAFVHLSARGALNGSWFDQNRAYAGLGWRVSPKWDVELGYMNQRINGRIRDTDNHITQFSVLTRLP